MDGEESRDEATLSADPLAVTAAALAATLGVRVQDDGGAPPTYRFQQAVHFAEGLRRRGVLDLAARRFRTTLWAGDHRCLDHLVLDALDSVTCDEDARRLVVEGGAYRLVLSEQGALTVVPLTDSRARVSRRGATDDALPT
jgi:hypothetical protein